MAPQTVSGSTGHPRFRQRLLGDGVPLQNDMLLPALANVQLVSLNFVASDQTSAKELDRACKTNLIDQVEMPLQKPQDPNVRGPRGCLKHPFTSQRPRLEVVQLIEGLWHSTALHGKQLGDAGSGCLEMLRLLVENGANIDVPMTGGQIPWHFMPCGSVLNGSTALRLAFLCNHRDVVKILVCARIGRSAA